MSEDEIRVPAGLTTDGLLGKRYMARFVDSLVLLFLLSVVIGMFGGTLPEPSLGFAATALFIGILLTVWIAYGTMLESSPWQATLGKRLMGLRVYDSQGCRMRPVQAAGRNLVKDGPFLLFGVLPGGQILAFLWLLAHLVVMHRSRVYQAIHDRAAHTWVAAPEETTQLRLT